MKRVWAGYLKVPLVGCTLLNIHERISIAELKVLPKSHLTTMISLLNQMVSFNLVLVA